MLILCFCIKAAILEAPFSVLSWRFGGGGYIATTTLKLMCWQWLFDSMQTLWIILPILPVLHLWDQPLAYKLRIMMPWLQTILNRLQLCQHCQPRAAKLMQQAATAEQKEMMFGTCCTFHPKIRHDARARVSRWSWWSKKPGSYLCHTVWSHYQRMISQPTFCTIFTLQDFWKKIVFSLITLPLKYWVESGRFELR